MHEVIQLAGIQESPGRARLFVRDALVAFPAEFVAMVQLLISELVTNAVVHGDPPVVLEVEIDPMRLNVVVADQGDHAPVLHEATPVDGHGRGLQIVARLADDWGVEWRDSGKAVWFTLNTAVDSLWSMN